MSVRSAQSITVEFVTSSPTTSAATDADSAPAGTLVVNGTDNGATVTVTHVDTGRYKAAVTLPTLAVGDVAELVISATVATIAGKAVIWRDTKDVLLDASGDVTYNNAAPPSAATVAAATWDLATIGHTTSGTFGAAAVAAGGSGDPWSTSLPGSYGAGTAGYIMGNNLNAAVSTRSTYAGGDTSGTTTLLARLTSTRAGYLDNLATAPATAATIWDLATIGHTTAGTFGAAAVAAGAAGDPWATTGMDSYPDGSAGQLLYSLGIDEATLVTDIDNALTASHGSGAWGVGSSVAAIASAVLTTQMTESYNAINAAPTLAQALFVTMQRLTAFAITDTVISVKQLNGLEAYALTMDDAANNATSSTRTT